MLRPASEGGREEVPLGGKLNLGILKRLQICGSGPESTDRGSEFCQGPPFPGEQAVTAVLAQVGEHPAARSSAAERIGFRAQETHSSNPWQTCRPHPFFPLFYS